MALRQGEYVRACTLAEEGLALFRKRGNLGESPYALLRLVEVSFLQGELARASDLAEECLLLCPEARGSHKTAALYLLGQIVLEQGDAARARTLAEECLARWQEEGNMVANCEALCLLGKVEARQGDHATARTCYDQSIQIARERGFQWELACGLEGLASVVAGQAEARWAAQLWAAAEALRTAIGAPLPLIERASYEQAIITVRAQLGGQAFAVAWAQGRTAQVEQVINDALKMDDEAGTQ